MIRVIPIVLLLCAHLNFLIAGRMLEILPALQTASVSAHPESKARITPLADIEVVSI